MSIHPRRRDFLNTTSKRLALASVAGILPIASAAPQNKNTAGVDTVTGRRRGVGLIAVDHQRSAGGYTLFTPQTDDGNVYLIDIDGAIAHRWKMPNRPGRHAVLLPSGNLGYNGSHPNSPTLYPMWSVWHGGAFAEVTPSGKTVWEFEDVTHHHDAEWLANGNLLYGAAEPLPKNIANLVAGGTTDTVYGDVVKEVNRKGELVWKWSAADHLKPSDFPINPLFERVHWPLINGLWETRQGLILMSLRTTSGIIAVDKKSGSVVYHIGAEIISQISILQWNSPTTTYWFSIMEITAPEYRLLTPALSKSTLQRRLSSGSMPILPTRPSIARSWATRSVYGMGTLTSPMPQAAACSK